MESATPKVLLLLVWALPISLATTFGIVFYFLFLRVIRCFSSPGSLHYAMYSRNDTVTLLTVSSLIRISTDLSLFATPRSFSQLVTSFFGAMYQGILLYALCSLIFFLKLHKQFRRIFSIYLILQLRSRLFLVNRSYAFPFLKFRINLSFFLSLFALLP